MRTKLTLILLPFLVACTDDLGQSESQNAIASKTYDNQQDAEDNSPVGLSCLVSGELKTETVCVPDNRGKNGKCTNREVTTDTRIFESAFLRGDVDYDGVAFTRDDAQLATKNLYVKQLDKQPCPGAADIAPHEGIHDRYEADGYFTSNDINKWRDVKRGESPDMGIICASQCQIINHMSPEYK